MTIPYQVRKYIEEHEEPYSCINCGKPVEEPDASYCEECFRKGDL